MKLKEACIMQDDNKDIIKGWVGKSDEALRIIYYQQHKTGFIMQYFILLKRLQ